MIRRMSNDARTTAGALIACAVAAVLVTTAMAVGGCHDTPHAPSVDAADRDARPVESAAIANERVNWPVPTGWKHETLTFPLDFAPELPYRGVEELRFAPDFFEPASPTYWSYVFVWWLEDRPVFDAPTMSASLTEYFRGLSEAVGRGKHTFDSESFRATLTPKLGTEIPTLAGQVFTHDGFTTGLPLVLQVEARLRRCPASGRYSVTCMLSPRAFEDPVWSDLRACAAAFDCR